MSDRGIRRDVECVDFKIGTHSSLDGPPKMESNSHPSAMIRAEFRRNLGMPRVSLQILCAPKLHYDLDR